jgi:hypothetical protein
VRRGLDGCNDNHGAVSLRMMARHPRDQRKWCWARQALDGGVRLIGFYDIEIAASDLSDYLIGFGSFEVGVVGGPKGTSNSRKRISSREGYDVSFRHSFNRRHYRRGT